jgi:hypothetical protein
MHRLLQPTVNKRPGRHRCTWLAPAPTAHLLAKGLVHDEVAAQRLAGGPPAGVVPRHVVNVVAAAGGGKRGRQSSGRPVLVGEPGGRRAVKCWWLQEQAAAARSVRVQQRRWQTRSESRSQCTSSARRRRRMSGCTRARLRAPQEHTQRHQKQQLLPTAVRKTAYCIWALLTGRRRGWEWRGRGRRTCWGRRGQAGAERLRLARANPWGTTACMRHLTAQCWSGSVMLTWVCTSR